MPEFPILELVDLTKSFAPGEPPAVAGVSLAVGEGEVVALMGPSGCGKSTLLSLVAGLEVPDAGAVLWRGRSLAGVPTHRRGFGLMFQDYALFPHLDVAGNVGFGLRMAGVGRDARAAEVAQALAAVGLAGYERRSAYTLSGGEQQRVALARALAPRPQLLMLDEPLGALDRRMRDELLAAIRQLLAELGLTALYVTHDQDEAFAVAGRVAVMQAGRIVQVGTPEEVYARPANRFVAEFLGFANILTGTVVRRDGRSFADTAAGLIPLPEGADDGLGLAGSEVESAGAKMGLIRSEDGSADSVPTVVEIVVRPEAATPVADDVAGMRGTAIDDSSVITGQVLDRLFQGSRSDVRLQAGDVALRFNWPAALAVPQPGNRIRLRIDPGAVHVFPAAPT